MAGNRLQTSRLRCSVVSLAHFLGGSAKIVYNTRRLHGESKLGTSSSQRSPATWRENTARFSYTHKHILKTSAWRLTPSVKARRSLAMHPKLSKQTANYSPRLKNSLGLRNSGTPTPPKPSLSSYWFHFRNFNTCPSRTQLTKLRQSYETLGGCVKTPKKHPLNADAYGDVADVNPRCQEH